MDKFPIFTTEHAKIRIGKNNDGGYIICDIPNIRYDILLSGGVQTDISFEEALLQKYPGLTCVAFDGTVDSLPKHNSRIQFVKKNIGSESTDTITNLKEYIEPYSNIFMKMDIEGWEDPLFRSLADTEIQKIAHLAVEVHWGARNIVAERLKDSHYLVHFHPNNNCNIDMYGLPEVFELTYIRKDLCQFVVPSTDPIPNPALDMKNDITKGDILYRNGKFTKQTKVLSTNYSIVTRKFETGWSE